jgi:hypothetical protein
MKIEFRDLILVGAIVGGGYLLYKAAGGLKDLIKMPTINIAGGDLGGGGVPVVTEPQQGITPALIDTLVTEPSKETFEIEPVLKEEDKQLGSITDTIVQTALTVTKVNPITAPISPIIDYVVGAAGDTVTEMALSDISQPTETYQQRADWQIETYGERLPVSIGGR